MLSKEYEYFHKNLPELLKKYKNKYLIIRRGAVVEVFDTEQEALQYALSKFDLGTFLIQYCVEDKKITADFVNYRFVLGNAEI
ncbi:MAG: hypothetical protein UR61_C0052G0002 [candidate division WS6 bacterium GW2011_GWE1_34_7]|uniref:Uncharacterized protein n=2 Tax=Candidatus Dojkabacteria TaxID=74243 RepID=A0A0G0DMA6_9BACT|nr:MAG: hypothetical protein UR61_C0052G0002 [candidate division WS6 bacterium GW2011_GWE1_34_7]KKP77792.1 MAG: hypothetical protein UR73_C0011G0006 [candidate division WS6 bacterium GW2011_GWF1_35_23]